MDRDVESGAFLEVVQRRAVLQILVSMTLTLAFAILLQQERSTVLAVTLNGGVGERRADQDGLITAAVP
ncbi:hypothetical protein [Streptomyces sp. wa22]|uniref:hypothetical protein n=1 Tax=Streptomyces sp. wa22 TaxID=1828244 RepID=UPI0011CA8EC1|nr:hypothetical protein [Streptomyces sp. wa22]TXS17315.1 hypothetical protein EAO68_05755 [Streptomyces sp. wa22]